MQRIDISATPNQEFSFSHGRNNFNVRLVQAHGCMVADIDANGAPLVRGQRCLAGILLLPYKTMWRFGNFLFDTENDELPWWERFGIDHFLYYITPEELENSIPEPLPERRLPSNYIFPDPDPLLLILRVINTGAIRETNSSKIRSL